MFGYGQPAGAPITPYGLEQPVVQSAPGAQAPGAMTPEQIRQILAQKFGPQGQPNAPLPEPSLPPEALPQSVTPPPVPPTAAPGEVNTPTPKGMPEIPGNAKPYISPPGRTPGEAQSKTIAPGNIPQYNKGQGV